ncbi:MAG: DUF433 domain-containing protein [Verrucomicrobia bacterium]|nr:DUF433 domain-containing protein [Verrucomicrobiota bacterium]
MNDHPNITADPTVMTGMPCIKGTRVTVANVVRQIAAGRAPEEICRDYPLRPSFSWNWTPGHHPWLSDELIETARHLAGE